jgi:hypothetical protein
MIHTMLMVDFLIQLIQFDIYSHFLHHQLMMFVVYNVEPMIHTKIKSSILKSKYLLNEFLLNLNIHLVVHLMIVSFVRRH